MSFMGVKTVAGALTLCSLVSCSITQNKYDIDQLRDESQNFVKVETKEYDDFKLTKQNTLKSCATAVVYSMLQYIKRMEGSDIKLPEYQEIRKALEKNPHSIGEFVHEKAIEEYWNGLDPDVRGHYKMEMDIGGLDKIVKAIEDTEMPVMIPYMMKTYNPRTLMITNTITHTFSYVFDFFMGETGAVEEYLHAGLILGVYLNPEDTSDPNNDEIVILANPWYGSLLPFHPGSLPKETIEEKDLKEMREDFKVGTVPCLNPIHFLFPSMERKHYQMVEDRFYNLATPNRYMSFVKEEKTLAK